MCDIRKAFRQKETALLKKVESVLSRERDWLHFVKKINSSELINNTHNLSRILNRNMYSSYKGNTSPLHDHYKIIFVNRPKNVLFSCIPCCTDCQPISHKSLFYSHSTVSPPPLVTSHDYL